MKKNKVTQKIQDIKRQLRRHKRSMYIITAVLVLLLCVISVSSISLKKQNEIYIQKEKELQKDLELEEEREKEIEDFAKYVKTDEYIKKLAKDKLGLVFPDEILFKAEK